MELIYENDVTKMDYIEGTEYSIRNGVSTLFAIPERNSVGTNCFNNAIIKINFDKPKLQLDYVMKDFLPHVNTGQRGLKPLFSDQYIGWIRTRSFVLIDYKKKQMITEYMPDGSIHSNLSGGKLINKEKMQFLFVSGETKGFVTKITMFLCEFSGGKGKIVKTKAIGEDDRCLFGKTTFVLRKLENKKQKLIALDSNLNEIDHPLTDFYNKKHKGLELDKFYYMPFVHPDLPFAIVKIKTEDYFDTWVVTWNKKNELLSYKLSEKLSAGQISPDGKWIFFLSFPTLHYVLMPVKPDLEHYLGEPILLKGYRELYTGINAWISDPLSFVVSDEDEKKLIKWDISKKNIKKR